MVLVRGNKSNFLPDKSRNGMNAYTQLPLGAMLTAHARRLSIASEPHLLAMESRSATRMANRTDIIIRSAARKAARELAMVKRHLSEGVRETPTAPKRQRRRTNSA